MLDTLLTGARVVDGTGAPARRADVGLRDGRIAALGKTDEPARRRIDADGLVVAPGIVDIHTHYDAQAFWDPTLSPSPLHGVTTVVGGNCGFSVAPLVPDAGDYLMRMLARVEGMPLASLEVAVPWDWTSFGDYLDRLEGRLAVNAGFLVGHSALRRVAMGEAAVGEPAGAAQLEAMKRLLAESLAAGGLGFSSSQAHTHNDGDGNPVPSRFATPEEVVELCGVLRGHPGTTLEFIPTVGFFEDAHRELMTRMSLAAGRPLNWNVLVAGAGDPALQESQLAASDHAAERGARVAALTVPFDVTTRLNLASGFLFETLPEWADVVALPIPERVRALSQASVRERLRKGFEAADANPVKFLLSWENLCVAEAFTAAGREWVGRRMGDVAAELGRDALDVMLDLAVSEELRTSFQPAFAGRSAAPEVWRARADLWKDPRTIVGASDAGAHLDMMDGFAYASHVLGPAVREHGVLALEEAVHQLTGVPAAYYGLVDRGQLTPGARADLVLFDAGRIGPGRTHTRADLPAGASRLYAEPEGIERVFVNGVEIVREGRFSGERPGAVLRSGRDTRTVALSGEAA